MSAEKRLQEMGLTLLPPPRPGGNYVPLVQVGNLAFVAGHVPRRGDGSLITGKLGRDLTVEQGYEAARVTALHLLSTLRSQLGSLDRVKRVVRLFCMVNATDDFTQHPEVANGASDLLTAVFGEAGRHARCAIGMSSLPRNVAVEIEMQVEVA